MGHVFSLADYGHCQILLHKLVRKVLRKNFQVAIILECHSGSFQEGYTDQEGPRIFGSRRQILRFLSTWPCRKSAAERCRVGSFVWLQGKFIPAHSCKWTHPPYREILRIHILAFCIVRLLCSERPPSAGRGNNISFQYLAFLFFSI